MLPAAAVVDEASPARGEVRGAACAASVDELRARNTQMRKEAAVVWCGGVMLA